MNGPKQTILDSRNPGKQLENANTIREKIKNLNKQKEAQSRSKSPIISDQQTNKATNNYLNNSRKNFGIHFKGMSNLKFDSSSSESDDDFARKRDGY